jgi:DNA-binding response OmpR family regulator
VLLVEDDVDLAGVVIEALEQDGHKAVHVRAPSEACALADSDVWDVFLVDAFGEHLAPDDDYRATVRQLAEYGSVVVTTGRAWAASADAHDLGVDALLTKPYDLTDLADTLSALPTRPGRSASTS